MDLLGEHPEHRDAQGKMFRHLLVDEMQDTNIVQVELVEAIARAGTGNLTAVGDDAQSIYRFRGAHYDNILKFPDRNPGSRLFRLETNYRSTPEIVAFTNASIAQNPSGFPKTLVSARPAGPRPVVVATADAFEEADLICQQVLDWRERGHRALEGRGPVPQPPRLDPAAGRAAQRGIPYTVRSGMRFFEQAHIKDVLAYLRVHANPRDEPAWARLLPLLPGIGPAKSAAIRGGLASRGTRWRPWSRRDDDAGAGQEPGGVRRLRRRPPLDPQGRPGVEPLGGDPRGAPGGYPAIAKANTSTPTSGWPTSSSSPSWPPGTTASTSSSPTCSWPATSTAWTPSARTAEDDGEQLVLSTIHQAKGLEWSRVIVPRLVEHGFPGDRALAEAGGEDEERRVFYVAVTRAMDELWLTYPLMVSRPGPGSILTSPEPVHHRDRPGPLRAGRRRDRERPGLDRGPRG